MTRAAVLGPGAVGGLVAALFWRQGFDVVCVARERTASMIREEGILVQSGTFGEFTARPRAATALDTDTDLLVVATKSASLPAAVQKIPPSCTRNAAVVPLLNGLEHVGVLRSRFGRCVAPGAISVESRLLGPNRVAHLSPGCRVLLGSADFGPERMQETAALFRSAGMESEVRENEDEVLWGKLVRLNALACTTAARGGPIGCVRNDPYWFGLLRACLAEGAEVARRHGVDVSVEDDLAFIARFPDGFTTSMQRDVAAGRETELDAITGALLRAGAEQGVECPTIRQLMDTIRGAAANRAVRGRADE